MWKYTSHFTQCPLRLDVCAVAWILPACERRCGETKYTGASPNVSFNPQKPNTASIRTQWGLKQEEQLSDSPAWQGFPVSDMLCHGDMNSFLPSFLPSQSIVRRMKHVCDEIRWSCMMRAPFWIVGLFWEFCEHDVSLAFYTQPGQCGPSFCVNTGGLGSMLLHLWDSSRGSNSTKSMSVWGSEAERGDRAVMFCWHLKAARSS